VYSVVIDGTGHVKYSGEDYVRDKGDREAEIARDDVRALLQKFVKTGFFALDDKYFESVTDCETTTLTVKIGDRTKRIENYWSHDAAGFSADELGRWQVHVTLDMLAESVDRVVDVLRWVGFDNERLKPAPK
jgi:hypothetical protein